MVIGVGWQQYHYKHQTVMILRLQVSGLDWESDLNNFALDQNSVPRQINTLLYCLGEDAKDVLTSTEILNEDRKKYAQVLAKSDSFFQPRKNFIFEKSSF